MATFYDDYYEAPREPDLPSYDFVIDDSPSCHQSLKHWSNKAAGVTPSLLELTKSVELYYNSGVEHSKSATDVGTKLAEVAKAFSQDEKLAEPLLKFADTLQRIECYRDMLLSQTQILTLQPLQALNKEYQKVKDLETQVQKGREALHLAWEKFANCPHMSNLQEPYLLDKLAHNMLHTRHNYQRVLLKYITALKEIHTLKKVIVLQKVLEHMLAQFSFFNFGYQTLKDMEPYMNNLFQELQQTHANLEDNLQEDEDVQAHVEAAILNQYQKDGQGFADPQPTLLGSATLGQSVNTVNTHAGKIFTRIGDLFQSGSFGIGGTKKPSTRPGSQIGQEPESWEVIDAQGSSSPKVGRGDAGAKSVEDSKGEGTGSHGKRELKAQPLDSKESQPTSDDSQEKVLSVVTKDLLSPDVSTAAPVIPTATAAAAAAAAAAVAATGKGMRDAQSKREDMKRRTSSAASFSEKTGKRGYLRIKQKAFPKNRWPLLYFIVDRSGGTLLAQGQEQLVPSTMENLLLCTVKLCDATDVDRNYCFQLISPSSERIFQAHTDQEVQEWVSSIQEATSEALKNSKAKLKSLARFNVDSSSGPGKEVRNYCSNASERIRKIEGNRRCADCSSPRPDWASINLGILVCIECSGVHRSMGVHVSKVRSLTLDKWEESTVQFMEGKGNDKVNKIYEADLGPTAKLTRDSEKEDRRDFIRKKYIERKFCAPHEDSVDPELSAMMERRPGEDETDLLNDSVEHILSQDERSSLGSSPLCLIEDCKECPHTDTCVHRGEKFASAQLTISDAVTPGDDALGDESQC